MTVVPQRTVEFFVPGVPVAQPRQKHRTARSKDGRQFIQNYTPARDPVNAFKYAVRMMWDRDQKPFAGPVEVEIVMIFPRPKSKTRKVNVREPKDTKPDGDNLAKAVWDSLRGVAWGDDSQVWRGVIEKWIAGDGDQVGTTVVIRGEYG